ncbi:MAG: hypothetical protein PVH79_04080 [Candidatus Bathyarchaeota archaeon]
MHRISNKEELLGLMTKSGYLLNIRRSRACLHRVDCALVKLVNPFKKIGVYHSHSIEEALGWAEEESVQVHPCKLCLESLTYRPRPEKITNSFRKRAGDL